MKGNGKKSDEREKCMERIDDEIKKYEFNANYILNRENNKVIEGLTFAIILLTLVVALVQIGVQIALNILNMLINRNEIDINTLINILSIAKSLIDILLIVLILAVCIVVGILIIFKNLPSASREIENSKKYSNALNDLFELKKEMISGKKEFRLDEIEKEIEKIKNKHKINEIEKKIPI